MAESTGIERMLQRIRNTIENGAYYEAQQTYKTAYYRYKAKSMINESFRILKEGASLQLGNGQINCGTELGNLLLEGYEEHQIEVNEDSIKSLRDLVLLLPRHESHAQFEAGSAEVEEGGRFLNHIIRWIKRKQPNSEYFQEFNSLAGDYLTSWEGGEALGRITIFYVRGKNWDGLSRVLVSSLEMSDTPNEEDLFISRCVLQLLLYSTSQTLQDAHALLETYSTIRSIPQTALTHFTEFLIEALEIPSERLMEMLVQKYAPILNRDKHLEHLLRKVKQQFFPRANEGLLSNILGGILQGSTS